MSNNFIKVENPVLIVEGKQADNERLKAESDYLRGTIVEDLQDRMTGGFTSDNFQLIRTHGMYQQDDREIRGERHQQNTLRRHAIAQKLGNSVHQGPGLSRPRSGEHQARLPRRRAHHRTLLRVERAQKRVE